MCYGNIRCLQEEEDKIHYTKVETFSHNCSKFTRLQEDKTFQTKVL